MPKTSGICRCVTNYTLILTFSCSFLISPTHYNNAGSSSIGHATNITLCHMLHPLLDALSLDGMTDRRGAPSSCATCYMLCPLCRWMPRISGCRLAGATPVLPSRGTAKCFTHSASGCLVFWRDDGSLGCTVEPCNLLYAPRYMLRPLCPRSWDDGSRGAPPSRANATRTKHHASPTLHVDTLLFSGMTARGLHRQAMQR